MPPYGWHTYTTGKLSCGKISIFMRLTASTLPATMPAIITMTVIGCRSAKRIGFMLLSVPAIEFENQDHARHEQAESDRGQQLEDAKDKADDAPAAIKRVGRRQAAAGHDDCEQTGQKADGIEDQKEPHHQATAIGV